MAKTAINVTDQDMAIYRATARKREEKERQELIKRAEKARSLAQRAAKLLKEQFGATEVTLFGSLARGSFFHRRSDIDLAVAGIESHDFWRACANLATLGSEFEIDLVDVDTVSPKLRLEIEREGVEL